MAGLNTEDELSLPCVITTINVADEVTLTAPKSATKGPVTNLQADNMTEWLTQDAKRGKTWITGPVNTQNWIGAFGLAGHNLSQDAKLLWGFYDETPLVDESELQGSPFIWGSGWSNTGSVINVVDSSGETFLDAYSGLKFDLEGAFLFIFKVENWEVDSGTPRLRVKWTNDDNYEMWFHDPIQIDGAGTYAIYVNFDYPHYNSVAPLQSWDPENDEYYSQPGTWVWDIEGGNATFDITEFALYQVGYSNLDDKGRWPAAYYPLVPFGAGLWGQWLFGGRISDEEAAELNIDSLIVLEEDQILEPNDASRRFFMLIDDPDNVDGYIRARRLVVGSYLSFEIDFQACTITIQNDSSYEQNDEGNEFSEKAVIYRIFEIRFDELQPEELEAYQMIERYFGAGALHFLSLSPNEESGYHLFTALCFTKEPPKGKPRFQRGEKTIKFYEVH